MPENHDTDFNWPDFVEKINSELIAAYGNFVHRVLTLGARLPENRPLSSFENLEYCQDEMKKLEDLHMQITSSLERHRYKEALRTVMSASQLGNPNVTSSNSVEIFKELLDAEGSAQSMAKLSFGWRLSRYLAIMTQPFLPFSAQRLWIALGETGEVSMANWDSATDWSSEFRWNDAEAKPLFQRLDLDEILSQEKSLAEESSTNLKPRPFS